MKTHTINYFCKECKRKTDHDLYIDAYLWAFNICMDLFGKCVECGTCNINKVKEIEIEHFLD
jgi:ribosomal protein L44E